MVIYNKVKMWVRFYLIPWQIRAYIINPIKCRFDRHFIATVLTEDMKPDYKLCLNCQTVFDLDFPQD